MIQALKVINQQLVYEPKIVDGKISEMITRFEFTVPEPREKSLKQKPNRVLSIKTNPFEIFVSCTNGHIVLIELG